MVNVARCAPRNARDTPPCNTGNRSTPHERDLEEALGQPQPQVAGVRPHLLPVVVWDEPDVHVLGVVDEPAGDPLPHAGLARSRAPRCPIFSYCDKVTFGITGDRAAADVLARGIADGLVQLAELARAERSDRDRPSPTHAGSG